MLFDLLVAELGTPGQVLVTPEQRKDAKDDTAFFIHCPGGIQHCGQFEIVARSNDADETMLAEVWSAD